MTRHLSRANVQSLGRRYNVLIETEPEISTECGVFAGIPQGTEGGHHPETLVGSQRHHAR
jgi:hypothetical protein